MRFKLQLHVERQVCGDILPLNYSYEFSAMIYKAISRASEEYAFWLHENGFTHGAKQFKLFTFSRLIVPLYTISGDRIRLKSDTVEWFVSFLPEQSTEKFIQGLFTEQTFRIGDHKSKVQFQVRSVELIPPPAYSPEMEFETLSPVCVSFKDDSGRINYLNPSDPKFKDLIYNNLLNRYHAIYSTPYVGALDFEFELLNTPRSNVITIKSGTLQQTRIRGYTFQFRLQAPVPLMQIAYESGFGEKNSIGFGMLCLKKAN